MSKRHISKAFQTTFIYSSIVLLAACGGGGGLENGASTAPSKVISPVPDSEQAPNENTQTDTADGPVTENPSPLPPAQPPDTETSPVEPAPEPAPTPAPTPEPAPAPTPTQPPKVETIPATSASYITLNCETCHTTLHDTVVDGNGNATTVWAEDNNGVRSIMAARLDAATGVWERYFLASGSPNTLQAGVDRLGNVKAAWVVGNDFYIAQFDTASRTWGAPKFFFRATMVPMNTKTFVVDPNGNAFFAYLWLNGATTAEGFPVQSIGAFVYNATDDTWKRGRLDGASEQALSATMGIDDAGTAIVVWSTRVKGEAGAYRGAVNVRRYLQRNAYWGHIIQLAADDAYDPRVAMRPNGFAVAAYGTTRDGVNDIHLRRYDPNIATWFGSRFFNLSSGESAHGLNVGVDRAGNAFVAWAETQRGQLIRRYNASTDSYAPVLAYNDGTDFSAPGLAVSPDGYAVHSYSNNDLQGTTSVLRYDAATNTWSTRIALNNSGEGGTSADVATGGNGTGVAVWRQPSGQTGPSGPIQTLKARMVTP